MAIARVFRGFFAFLIITFTAPNVFAAGYSCTIKYTSCKNANMRLSSTDAGNSCLACPTNSSSNAGNTRTYCTCDTGYSQKGGMDTTTISDDDKACVEKCNAIIWNATELGGSGGQTTMLYKKTGSPTWYSDSTCKTVTTAAVTRPTKANATFAGYYNTSATSGGTQFVTSTGTLNTASNTTVTSDTRLYARYNCNKNYTENGTTIKGACEANVYTINIWHNNSSTFGIGAVYEKYGKGWYKDSSATISILKAPLPSGYTGKIFRGYYSEDLDVLQETGNTGTRVIPASGTLPSNTLFTSDTIVYAAYARNCTTVPHGSCTLKLEDDGSVTYTTTCKDGYTLTAGAGTYNPTCAANTFNVVFNTNVPATATSELRGIVVAGNDQLKITCTYDKPCEVAAFLSNALSGWTFVGWALSPTADLVKNPDLALEDFKNLTTTPGADVNVYAIWYPNTYAMNLNSNPQGSNIGVPANTVDATPNRIYEWFDTGWYNTETHTTPISSITIPTQTGYTFDGFRYTNVNNNDESIEIIDKHGKIVAPNNTFAKNATAYAQWTANRYDIVFNQNGGTDGPLPMLVTYDSPVPDIDAVNLPHRPGFTFAGYCDKQPTNDQCTGTMYFDKKGKYIADESGQWRTTSIPMILYAVWSECKPGRYCPGNTYDEEYFCSDLERVAHPTFDITTIDGVGYWSSSDDVAVNASDCYRICRNSGDSVTDDPATNKGHGTLLCATDPEKNKDGQCRAYYDPDRGDTDNGSCKYTTTKSTCHTGYSPSFAGHEIASCEPDGYHVTYHQNDGSTDTEWTYTQSCIVFSDCILEDLTAGAHKLPDRTGYVFTGWSTTRAYNPTPWNGVNLKTTMPGTNNDGPTGDVPLYAVWGECAAGYYWDGDGACVACPVDTYKKGKTIAYGENDIQSCKPCGVGKYTRGTANTNDNACLTCEAGSFCDGNGIKTCPDYELDSNFANFANLFNSKYTSAPGATMVTDCYIDCPTINVEYGRATPNDTRVNYEFQCEYTCVSETGNPGHVENGVCKEDSCRPEFEFKLVNGISVCTRCNRENAITYSAGGNCIIETCAFGYHKIDNECIPDEVPCTVANAISAYKVWQNGKLGECIPRECNDRFHIDGKSCVSDIADCNIKNDQGSVIGSGKKEWDSVHNRWGECDIDFECIAGYTDDPYESNEPTKKCGECRNKYGVMVRDHNGKWDNIAVAYYTGDTGCTIGACKYQGQMYNLEGNECVPICDVNGYSDETGSMEWNWKNEVCAFKCEEGYSPWDENKSKPISGSTFYMNLL